MYIQVSRQIITADSHGVLVTSGSFKGHMHGRVKFNKTKSHLTVYDYDKTLVAKHHMSIIYLLDHFTFSSL